MPSEMETIGALWHGSASSRWPHMLEPPWYRLRMAACARNRRPHAAASCVANSDSREGMGETCASSYCREVLWGWAAGG